MRNKKKNRKNVKVFAAMILLIIITSISLTSVVIAGNKKESTKYRYFTTVEIQAGDTLWSIANDYIAGSGLEIREFIDEIKRVNHLTNDTIISGQYLQIFYYSEEYK